MATPSIRPGMGAVPYPGGVTFRVWAPFAGSVAVAGDFNAWSATANPLASEGEAGNWSADVPSAAAGQGYRFVVDGQSSWSRDSRSRAVTSAGDSAAYDAGAFVWPDGAFTTPAWNELVLYELHVGTFYDSTPSAPGTFRDAAQKLPYLAALGVNAVQVMPVHGFSGAYNYGYDVSDPFAVTATYGGPDAFKAFVAAAHAQGIAVVLDVVYNHWGPDGLTLWRYDGWYEGAWGGIYFYQDGRAATPWTAAGRPDYGRGEVRQYVRDNAMMWLTEFRVDGLRWDSVSYTRNVYGSDGDPANDLADGWSLIQWVGDQKNAVQPWKILIGEDLHDNAWITRGTGGGGAGCDAQWDLGFAETVRGAIVGAVDDARDMGSLKAALAKAYDGDAFRRVIYTESHDEAERGKSRVPDAIAPGDSGSYDARKRSTLGAALVLTAPGIPMILQGQEFLEWHYFEVDPNDDSEMDWTLPDQYPGIVLLYRDLIRLRRNWFDNTRGLRGQHVNPFFASDADKVLAFHRWDQGGPGDDVIVVANLRNTTYPAYTIGFPRPGTWYVRFNGDARVYGPDYGDTPGYDTTAITGDCQGMPCHGDVGLAPYSVLVLSQ